MKRFLRAAVITLVVLMALGAGAVPAFAAAGADLTASPQYLRAGVDLPVFGVDLTSDFLVSSLQEVHVEFTDIGTSNFSAADDLDGSPDGVVLWRDSSNLTPATQDKFDDGDTRVTGNFTFVGNRATLEVNPDFPLPAPNAMTEGLYTFLLTIRLAPNVSGPDFTVTLPTDAFDTATLATSIEAVESHTIIADSAAPTVTLFTPASSQTANISWLLSEPIVGVDEGAVSDNVVLRATGSTEDLPATVSYNNATKTITLDPDAALIAGQKYNAILLPNGARSITDRAGNELQPKTNLFRAATDVSEVAPGVRYSWRNLANSSAYGGSYVVNNTPGATIAYTFVGSSIAWYTIRDPYQGVTAVSIDGRSFGTVNNYSSTARYKVGKSFSGLTAGTHTITIRVTGSKGSSSGKDVRVSIDAFRSGGSTNVTPSLSYRWAAVSASGADGGTYRVARFSGTEMTFVFSGTSIAWRTVRGPAMGQAYVYIDGALKGLIDNYSSTTSYKVLRAFLNLTDTTHTIRIKVASTRNSRATDRNIAVDGFVIG